MSGRRMIYPFIGIILAVIGLDQATKMWIFHNFALHES